MNEGQNKEYHHCDYYLYAFGDNGNIVVTLR